MALPKLNDVPKYETVVPSTQEKIRFRPFLVKEEKVLLIALESGENSQVSNAIIDIIKSCTEGVNADNLTAVDIEYLFLKIRSKAVGETSNIRIKCKECDAENELKISLDSVKVPDFPKDNIIQLSDTVTAEMRVPAFKSLINNPLIQQGSAANQIFGLMIDAIAAIHTEEERIDAKDVSREELAEFLDSMTGPQFAKLKKYVESIPSLKHKEEYTCKDCGEHNDVEIQGLQNFF